MEQLADEYASLIKQLSQEDAEALKSVITTVFDIHRHLRSDSVAAVAAGGPTGDLYDRLTDAIPTALHIARTLLSFPEGDRTGLRKQLGDLNDLLKRTGQWLTSAEEGRPRTPAELSGDLGEVTQRIDRILETVRRPVTSSSPSGMSEIRSTSTTE